MPPAPSISLTSYRFANSVPGRTKSPVRAAVSRWVAAAPVADIMYSTRAAFSFRSSTRLWNACDRIPISSPDRTSMSTP